MRPERITIDEVLEIFADYLEQTKNFEVVETQNMGMLTVWDASKEKDRSFLSVEPVLDVDDLIQQILWVEISDCYYSEDHDMLDPCNCDEAVETLVYSRMKPRLEKLPRKWDGLLEEFFADPDQHN